MKTISRRRLRLLLKYLPSTGNFFWRQDARRGQIKAGSLAGSVNRLGYVTIGLNGKPYLAHRLAWIYVHGKWPDGEVDHRNADKGDNRFFNLRDVGHQANVHNQFAPQANSTTKIRGVSFHKAAGKFMAKIKVDGKSLYLGLFTDAEDAGRAYLAAKAIHHRTAPIQMRRAEQD